MQEQVNWTTHQQQLQRDRKPCNRCGDPRWAHPWKICPATGKICNKCRGSDHFARVCTEAKPSSQYEPKPSRREDRYPRLSRSRNLPNNEASYLRGPTKKRDVHSLHLSEVDETGPYEQCYSLEPRAPTPTPSASGKRYFVNLDMSETWSIFTSIKVQIDTAATCNTISDKTLAELLPTAKIRHSPYLLYPYGDSKPIKPLGQVELMCERLNKYDMLVFQVLPESMLRHKPALLSGYDSERLGLITV